MPKTYLIDVWVRGKPGGVTDGDEPVIAATRIGVEVPSAMDYPQVAHTLGEQLRKIGCQFLENSDQLILSLRQYDAAMSEETDHSDTPPEFRPN